MSMPSDWTDRLFARLAVRYGDKWQRMYPEIDMAAVRADWAEVLDGMTGPALSYGIVNLPLDWPPNAMQFRAICERAPERQLIALPAPDRDPKMVAKLAATTKHVAAQLTNARRYNPKAWATVLKARDEAGEKLTITQRAMYRAALTGRQP